MGRNLPSITQVFQEDKKNLICFRRLLPRHEHWVIDELLAFAHKHIPAVAYAGHPLPFVMFLLAMLVEQHRRLKRVELGVALCALAEAGEGRNA
jgi:hypothetical protein